ncbi:MAG: hypothetical protein JF630_10125 [Geodermatophilales bacterium]|nr:hypothetical protein [Geodermatophilales bacterium]
MPDHDRISPYRLPGEVASQIRRTARPVAAVDHSRRRAFVSRILAIELAGGAGAGLLRAGENLRS